MGSVGAIPTVDISAWIDPNSSEESRQNVVDAMRHACTTYGFFSLVGHGVPREAQRQALDCAKLFFTLSTEEKMDEGLLPDPKECFIIGHEVPEDDPDCGSFSTGPNLWPKALPDEKFRIPIMKYQARMLELVKVLLKILARGLPKE